MATNALPTYLRDGRMSGGRRTLNGMPIADLSPAPNIRMGGSNAEGFTPGRGRSVSEIMHQRSNAYDAATGKPVAPGTRLFTGGWNTSGVGPGTAGYRGSYRQGGYNYGEGTRRPSARTSDEFYRQRDFYEGNPLDRLDADATRSTTTTQPEYVSPIDVWADRTTYGDKASQTPPVAKTNVYDENVYAPSPPVELMNPAERSKDIGMRLEALRREADRGFQENRAFEEAKFVQPKVQGMQEIPVSSGRGIRGTYGRGMVTTEPTAKSFTVDTPDLGQIKTTNLTDAARESAGASAVRRTRGIRDQMRSRFAL
jgi:hypothetical protein